MRIGKTFRFDAAHFLPNVPDEHKCKRLHGHTYHVTVSIEGPVGFESGWVMDYGVLSAVVKPII